ncbi:MAG TPA: hypothetical protein PLX06_11405 [Fimbriimonadaceae bacterium]|nr:hypothetical protein [Fimbriimonadaceae bacterium]
MRNDPDLEAILAAAMEDGLPGEDPASAPPEDPRLPQFKRIAAAMRVQQFSAPDKLISAAKELMPAAQRRQIWARLVGGSMALAGARSATADSFQLTFEAEGARTRLMYERGPAGWEVAGQAPEGYAVARNGKSVKLDAERRFTFAAKTLGDSGLSLLDEVREIVIPPANEAEADESNHAD